MRVLYFDAFAGVSGDMTVGALLDLGLDLERLRAELAALPLSGYALRAEPRLVNGIGAVKFDVLLDGEPAGLELCRRLRQLSPTVPILIVSALSEPAHRIEGLREGADDYVTKPFEMDELLLRIEKILLRSAWLQRSVDGDQSFSWDGITVDFASLEANVRGNRIQMTLREAMLLRLLVELRGQVVSRDTILDRVWGNDAFPSTRTVDNFLVRLRRHFEPDPKTPRYFHSVRGMGYKFTPGSENR